MVNHTGWGMPPGSFSAPPKPVAGNRAAGPLNPAQPPSLSNLNPPPSAYNLIGAQLDRTRALKPDPGDDTMRQYKALMAQSRQLTQLMDLTTKKTPAGAAPQQSTQGKPMDYASAYSRHLSSYLDYKQSWPLFTP